MDARRIVARCTTRTILLALLISSLLFAVPTEADSHLRSTARGERRHIAYRARDRLGANYCWSGETRCFDCSGLTYRVYRRHGAAIPRDTRLQWRARRRYGWTTKWHRSGLRKGDLVFFVNTYKPGISHVGIYIKGGRFIHANDDGVVFDSFRSDYWRRHFKAGVRPKKIRKAYYS
jgi:peptidoglycan DL-endopeptidase LytE